MEKVSAILDSRKVFGRNKQYKCLLKGYSLFEFEWISENNLGHVKELIKEFEAHKSKEAKIASKSTSKKKTSSLAPLAKDAKDLEEIPEEDTILEPTTPKTKFKRNKRQKSNHIFHRR